MILVSYGWHMDTSLFLISSALSITTSFTEFVWLMTFSTNCPSGLTMSCFGIVTSKVQRHESLKNLVDDKGAKVDEIYVSWWTAISSQRRTNRRQASFWPVKDMDSLLGPWLSPPQPQVFCVICYSKALLVIPAELQQLILLLLLPQSMWQNLIHVHECECLVWLTLSFLHHRISSLVHLGLTGVDWVQVLFDCRCHLKIAFIPPWNRRTDKKQAFW